MFDNPYQCGVGRLTNAPCVRAAGHFGECRHESTRKTMAEKFAYQYQDADISDALRAGATSSRTVNGLRFFRFSDGSEVEEYGDGEAWRVRASK